MQSKRDNSEFSNQYIFLQNLVYDAYFKNIIIDLVDVYQDFDNQNLIYGVEYQIGFLRKLPYSMLFSVRHHRD